MARSIRFPGRCFLLLVSVITIAGCANLLSPWHPPSGDDRLGGQDTRRRPEVQARIRLQASLMTFADRFASQVAENTMVLERRVTSPELRLKLARDRLYYLASLYDIVTGACVGVALFDAVVLVSLTRMVWEEYWAPQVFGAQAELPRQVREASDVTIAKIAARVTMERRDTIEQFMTGLSRERQQLLTDITAEEQRLARILPEIRHTLDAGAGLMAEVNRTMASVDPLLASMGAEKRTGLQRQRISRTSSTPAGK